MRILSVGHAVAEDVAPATTGAILDHLQHPRIGSNTVAIMTELPPGSSGRASPERALSLPQYERFAPLVRRAAIRFARQLPSTVDVSALIRAGLRGLGDALRQLDPAATPEQAEQYAWYRIRSAMLDHARSRDGRTRDLRKASRRLTAVIAAESRALGRAPDESEIAAAMDLEIPAYRRLLTTLASGGMIGLEIGDPHPSIDHEPTSPATPGVEARSTVQALASAVGSLPIMLQQILALRHQEQCTPPEIAAVLDLTEARVIQLHVETVHRLRAGMRRS